MVKIIWRPSRIKKNLPELSLTELPPGTVLNHKSKTWSGLLIRCACGNKSNHTSIITRLPGPPTEEGIFPTALADYKEFSVFSDKVIKKIKKSNFLLTAQLPPEEILKNPECQIKLLDYFLLKKGKPKPYSKIKALLALFKKIPRKNNPDPTSVFCTEEVGLALMYAGILQNIKVLVKVKSGGRVKVNFKYFIPAKYNPHNLIKKLKKEGFLGPYKVKL